MAANSEWLVGCRISDSQCLGVDSDRGRKLRPHGFNGNVSARLVTTRENDVLKQARQAQLQRYEVTDALVGSCNDGDATRRS